MKACRDVQSPRAIEVLYEVEKRGEKGAILTALGMAPGLEVSFLWRESGGFGEMIFPATLA